MGVAATGREWAAHGVWGGTSKPTPCQPGRVTTPGVCLPAKPAQRAHQLAGLWRGLISCTPGMAEK